MKAETRLGLIAIGLVLGLFLCIGGVIALVVGGKGATTNNPKAEIGKGTVQDLAGPVSTGSKDDPVAYILGHRWWKKPPSKKRLDDLVAMIIAMDPSKAAEIDRDAIFEPCRHPAVIMKQYADGSYENLFIRSIWNTRPDRNQVLSFLQSELDRREYLYGPGR